MKRRSLLLITVVCTAALALCLAGCGSKAPSNTLKNDTMAIEGIYVDESYDGSNADKDVKRLYIFAEITAAKGTISVSSASFKLEASREKASDTLSSMDVVQKDTDGGSGLANLATSYSCTNVISEITPGSSKKIIIPFNVPTYYLEDGSTFTLDDSSNISDGIKFNFTDIIDSENLETIAQSVDSDGYAAAMEAREDASPEVAQDVMNRLNNYEYYVSVGGLTRKYTFEGNRFVASASGIKNPGTYTVKKGYLACLQDSTGWITWIPWEYSDKYDNGIDVNINDSFTEK